MDMLFGLLIGTVWAVLDGVLMRRIMRRAAADIKNAQPLVMRGFIARYLLTLAVIAAGLLIPGVNAVGVIIPLIVQKIVALVLAFLQKNK